MSGMVSPFEGGSFRVTSIIGYRSIPELSCFSGPHYGLDIVGISSKNIISVSAGTVGWAGFRDDRLSGGLTWQWGNYVRVDGDDGASVYYCHMSKITARVGDRVIAGTILGTEGATGQVTGSHLHIELRRSGRKCNLPYSPSDPCSIAAYTGIPNAAGVYSLPDPVDEIIRKAALSEVWRSKMKRFEKENRYGWEFWRKIEGRMP